MKAPFSDQAVIAATDIETLGPPPRPDGSGLLRVPQSIVVAAGDDELRARVVYALRELAEQVVAVSDGYRLVEWLADAILDARLARPDLIVADSILVGCTGLSILSGVLDLGWETPVILLTRSGDDEARRRAWETGATGVLIEPFDWRELRAFANLALDPRIARTMRARRMPLRAKRALRADTPPRAALAAGG